MLKRIEGLIIEVLIAEEELISDGSVGGFEEWRYSPASGAINNGVVVGCVA